LLPFCTVWTENGRNVYCKAHTTRWAQLGRPDSAEYIAHCQQRGTARIDFRGLTPQLKLELQYAVQCRHDQANDHRRAAGHRLDHPHRQRRRSDLVARSHRPAMA
jgi:hypothetical protein